MFIEETNSNNYDPVDFVNNFIHGYFDKKSISENDVKEALSLKGVISRFISEQGYFPAIKKQELQENDFNSVNSLRLILEKSKLSSQIEATVNVIRFKESVNINIQSNQKEQKFDISMPLIKWNESLGSDDGEEILLIELDVENATITRNGCRYPVMDSPIGEILEYLAESPFIDDLSSDIHRKHQISDDINLYSGFNEMYIMKKILESKEQLLLLNESFSNDNNNKSFFENLTVEEIEF